MKNRFTIAQEKINNLKTQKFSDKDLRGLSKCEKQFIIENNNNVEVFQNGTTFYLFINKNRLEKKQLYAISKKQSIDPNGTKLFRGFFNYECWLTFDPNKNFSTLYFERRCCTAPNINMIFA